MSATPIGVHQVLVGASAGDAITGLARWFRGVLRRSGPSEIFALHIDQSIEHDVKPLAQYRPRQGRSILIFHASIGEPAVLEFLMQRREPVVLVYHNVTPAQYFARYDPRYAQLLEYGRYEVAQLRSRSPPRSPIPSSTRASWKRWATATCASCRRSATFTGSPMSHRIRRPRRGWPNSNARSC